MNENPNQMAFEHLILWSEDNLCEEKKWLSKTFHNIIQIFDHCLHVTFWELN